MSNKQWNIKDLRKNGFKYYLKFRPSNFPKGLFIKKENFKDELNHNDLLFAPHFPELGIVRFCDDELYYGIYRNCCGMRIPTEIDSFIKIPEGLIDFENDWEDFELLFPDYPNGFSWYYSSRNCPPFPMLNEDLYHKIIEGYYKAQ